MEVIFNTVGIEDFIKEEELKQKQPVEQPTDTIVTTENNVVE